MKKLAFLRSLFVLSALLIAGAGYAQLRNAIPLKEVQFKDQKFSLNKAKKNGCSTLMKTSEVQPKGEYVSLLHETFGNLEITGDSIDAENYEGYEYGNYIFSAKGIITQNASKSNNYLCLPPVENNYLKGYIGFGNLPWKDHQYVKINFTLSAPVPSDSIINTDIRFWDNNNEYIGGYNLLCHSRGYNQFGFYSFIFTKDDFPQETSYLQLSNTSEEYNILLDNVEILTFDPNPEFYSYIVANNSEFLNINNSPSYPWKTCEEEIDVEGGNQTSSKYLFKGIKSTNQKIENSTSWFGTTVTNKNEYIDLSFGWKVSCGSKERLALFVNGNEYASISDIDKQISSESFHFEPGTYTFEWAYIKDSLAINDEGNDEGMVNNIKVVYSSNSEPLPDNNTPVLTVDKSTVNFKYVTFPNQGNASVYISNTGKDDLVISEIKGISAPFGYSELSTKVIPQYMGQNLDFQFSPAEADKGIFTQIVTLMSNGGQKEIVLIGYSNIDCIIETSAYGQLSSVITDTSVDSLVIIGYLNTSDFSFIKNSMPNLKYLDMSLATVFENALPSSCLQNKRSLEEVILPEGLRTINSYAFENCTSLKEINLPEGLTNIYDYAFRNCSSLTGELLLPSTLQSIGYYAFEGTGYTVCRSKAVTPPSVNSGGLGNISLVYVPRGSAQAYRNNSYWNRMTIIDGDSMTEVSVTLTEAGTLGAEILKQAESVAVVNKLTIAGPLNIDDWNLIRNSMSSLVSIDLSACTVTSIPHSQFSDKYSLFEIVLPNDLKIIEYDAFLRCTKLTEIIIPESVTTIRDNAFNGCTLLGKINIPASLQSLGQAAFNGCTVLQSPIVIPKGITQIPSNAFYNCRALSDVTLPESLLKIESSAFYQCAISSIILPDQLTTVDSNAFQYCPLSEIILPATLTSIGSYAFSCSTLEKITCQQATPPVLNSDPFSNVDKTTCELSVPAWSVNMYKLAKYWMNFSNITTYEASVDHLPISGVFTMADGIRPQDIPSVTVQQGATLIVRGNQPFATNRFVMNHKLNNWGTNFSSCVFSNLINESPEMTAESVAMNFNVNGNRWFFLSFPYDINYSDITIDEGKFFVFRKYDGASRAEKGTSTVTGDSWKNIEPTETLKAGNGYIFQCSADVTNLMLKATMESKNQLFANTMRAIALNDYIPADGNAENQSWNLVGNPFPSYFYMNNIEYVTPITIWNGSSYEALSPVDDEYYLRPFEAFFVQKPTDVASIKFNPDGRAYPTNASNKVAPKKAVTNSERKVFNFVISNGNNTDKCRIVLNPKAKADYEIICDAAKFMSLDADVPQIYTVDRKGTTFAINERPEGNVMMGMYTGNAGSYTISLQTQVEGVNVFLLDRTTGEETDLTTQYYTFNASEGMDNNRFEVRFEAPGATGIDAENAVPVKVSVVKGALNVQAAVGSTIEVIDYAGLTVKRVNTTDTVTEIVLPQGAYIVVVNGKSYKAMLL